MQPMIPTPRGNYFPSSRGELDTGWLSVPVATGELSLRRIGSLVEVRLVNYRPQIAGTEVIAQLPLGYRPPEVGVATSVIATAWESGGPRRMFARGYGTFNLEAQGLDAAGSYLHASFLFMTDEPFPA